MPGYDEESMIARSKEIDAEAIAAAQEARADKQFKVVPEDPVSQHQNAAGNPDDTQYKTGGEVQG